MTYKESPLFWFPDCLSFPMTFNKNAVDYLYIR